MYMNYFWEVMDLYITAGYQLRYHASPNKSRYSMHLNTTAFVPEGSDRVLLLKEGALVLDQLRWRSEGIPPQVLQSLMGVEICWSRFLPLW